MQTETQDQNTELALVTGVTGLLGGRLVEAAMASGLKVRSLSRRDWDGAPRIPLPERYMGDLPDGIPPACMEGVDTVFHCAATDSGGDANVYAVNLRGSVNLAKTAAAAGVKKFIYVSSSSARADALSAYGLSKFRAEREIGAMESICPVIVRPNLIVGREAGIYGRMCRMVEALPALPFLGGGVNIVQPVHVDDLCQALLRCAHDASRLKGRVLNIGDPEGISLRELLQEMALARRGRRKIGITVPLWPARLAVRAAGLAGIRLPVNESNLKGLERVEHIPTRQDLEDLGIGLRPLAESLKPAAAAEPETGVRDDRALRIVVTGGGRMGLMHCMLVPRMKGAVLAGVVEKSGRAIGMLRGIGIDAPVDKRLDRTWSRKPDGIIIATPPASHLSLARQVLERGCAVLVEKPLSASEDQRREFEEMLSANPGAVIVDGYVMRRLPHIRSWIEEIKSGKLGKPLAFSGASLAGIMLGKGRLGWQGDRAVSGGGALISLGSHLLSVIYEAFGPPARAECETCSLYSGEVEDSAVVRFEYKELSGRLFASWSFPDCARAEHSLAIWLEGGTLILEGAAGTLIRPDGLVRVRHQLDYEVGFNMAPDFAGAGFSVELAEFIAAARTGTDGGGARKALEMEMDLFRMYGKARAVSRFGFDRGESQTVARANGSGSWISLAGKGPRKVLDCRDAGPTAAEKMPPAAVWDHIQIYPQQFSEAGGMEPERVRVTTPDFMSLSRHLVAGDFAAILRTMGLRGTAGAFRTALRAALRNRGADFWAAAEAMAASGAAMLPREFDGWVMLHPYLVDMALTLRAPENIRRMAAAVERFLPKARIGLHTNMLLEIRKELHSLGRAAAGISFLASPDAPGLDSVVSGSPDFEWTAEVGPGPEAMQRMASARPQAWTHGAESILIGASADKELGGLRREARQRAWSAAFPGAEAGPIF